MRPLLNVVCPILGGLLAGWIWGSPIIGVIAALLILALDPASFISPIKITVMELLPEAGSEVAYAPGPKEAARFVTGVAGTFAIRRGRIPYFLNRSFEEPHGIQIFRDELGTGFTLRAWDTYGGVFQFAGKTPPESLTTESSAVKRPWMLLVGKWTHKYSAIPENPTAISLAFDSATVVVFRNLEQPTDPLWIVAIPRDWAFPPLGVRSGSVALTLQLLPTGLVEWSAFRHTDIGDKHAWRTGVFAP